MLVTYYYLPLFYTIFACFYNIRKHLTKMHYHVIKCIFVQWIYWLFFLWKWSFALKHTFLFFFLPYFELWSRFVITSSRQSHDPAHFEFSPFFILTQGCRHLNINPRCYKVGPNTKLWRWRCSTGQNLYKMKGFTFRVVTPERIRII